MKFILMFYLITIFWSVASKAEPTIRNSFLSFSFRTKRLARYSSRSVDVSNFFKVSGIVCYNFSIISPPFPPKPSKMLIWNERSFTKKKAENTELCGTTDSLYFSIEKGFEASNRGKSLDFIELLILTSFMDPTTPQFKKERKKGDKANL